MMTVMGKRQVNTVALFFTSIQVFALYANLL